MDRDDIDPRIWGPPGWEFLDAIAGGYPFQATEQQQTQMAAFLNSLGYLLPCTTCRENYRRFAQKYPPRNHVRGRVHVQWWLNKYREASRPLGKRLDQILNSDSTLI